MYRPHPWKLANGVAVTLIRRNAKARFGNGHAALAGVSCSVVSSWQIVLQKYPCALGFVTDPAADK